MKLIALVLGSAVLLSGCGTTEFVADPPRTPRPTHEADAELDAPVANPAAITIPKLGVTSSLIPLGLGANGELETPPVTEPMQAGWYAGADPRVPEGDGDEIQPGEIGPAVVAAHRDGVIDGRGGQPGLFYRLPELVPGDEILIDRDGQAQLRFIVDRVESHPKDAFPTEAVYGPTDVPTLRAVTCGGSFDRAAGSYRENVVVFATLSP